MATNKGSNSERVSRSSLTTDRNTLRQRYTEERMEVIVEEKHGPLYNAIPCMPLPLAILLCVFNIGIPGLGTLLSAFTVFCVEKTRISSRGRAFCLNLLSAFLQMITFIIIVGWIWSIIWGMTFVSLASSKGETTRKQYYVRRQSSMPE
ncbi:protein SPEC3-like [Argonauta hians]